MAPASPIKRVTRARAAAKSTKEDAAPKKLGTTKVTKSTASKTATKPTKSTTQKAQTADDSEDELVEVMPVKKTTRTTTKPAAPLAAAPRRRVKVTPINAPVVDEPALEPEPEKPKRKTTTRAKKAAEPEDAAEDAPPQPSTRTRTTRTAATVSTTTKKTSAKATKTEALAPKTRGRPKKNTETEVTEDPEPVPSRTTRQTRSRSASVASQQPPDTVEVLPKTKAASRKKVTFQDVPEEDKENEPVALRKAAAKKAAPPTGMRAKPVRKPAATTTKKPAAARTRATKAEPRALTPKMITQVQHVPSADDSDDELNGAKTPVRDLSLSPRRNANFAASLSPAKKLDFTQTLRATSPQKLAEQSTLMSPARRPASPAKPSEVTVATTLTAAPAPGIQESPKRGMLDASVFSQSAMKPTRSPLKESLLQSPARRLFSPIKQKTPLSVHRDAENELAMQDLETVEEIAVSSHFRPSMSPQRSGRVHRMSDEELADELAMDMDFDQSVLKMTSPKKSPVKSFKSIISEALDEEPQMPIIHNDVEETAKAVEELQDSEDHSEVELQAENDFEETVEPAQVSFNTTDESSEEPEEEQVARPAPQGRGKAARLSQILFRSNRFREDDESSEDELAADQTPDRAPRLFRSSMTGNNTRSRLSTGVGQASNGNVDFTPLAAQMSGWFATSPEKTPNKQTGAAKTQSNGMFSPLAAQHIAGEIQINRDSTPRQSNASPGLRTSVNSRPSMTSSGLGSPEKSTFFADQMSSLDESVNDDTIVTDGGAEVDDGDSSNTVVIAENAAIFEGLQNLEEPANVDADAEEDTVIINKTTEELTTDLVNQVHASDTAMIEFEQLAQEAETMAEAEDGVQGSSSVYGDENVQPEETLNLSVMEREVTPEEQTPNFHVLEQAGNTRLQTNRPSFTAADEPTLNLHVLENGTSASATPVVKSQIVFDEPTLNLDVLERNAAATPLAKMSRAMDDQTLNLHVLEHNALAHTPSPLAETSVAAYTPEGSPEPTASPMHAATVNVTDDVATPVGRAITGPRLFNTVVSKVPLKPEGDVSPIKMPKKRSRSMSMSNQQSPPKRSQLTPNTKFGARSTSQPLVSPERQIRSAGPSPAQTTPGNMSFAVDDFGDSTLDGIDLPDDEMVFDVGRPADTPANAKSSKPVKSVAATPVRAPLETVGHGILHGAVIFVEVHTSEGADASGVYIDLLTQMGARCVKDWRWNPRASVHGGDDLVASSKIGITHVVYKDGGKRTLEKVRDAKGEVMCVGVRWVLDCEREGKWIDETPYIVDHGILPRGGSRRRKSMEPKALMNANGNISAGRRSTSAEWLTSEMREELINTPVRTYQPPAPAGRESLGMDSVMSESDISSTYNSPTTTMNVRYMATPTALVGWDPATSKTPAKAGNSEMDTPYLMKQGGMIMDHARDNGAMSAPPKQINKGMFDQDDENDGENRGEKLKLKLNEARRRTMGFKPVVGSPLGKF